MSIIYKTQKVEKAQVGLDRVSKRFRQEEGEGYIAPEDTPESLAQDARYKQEYLEQAEEDYIVARRRAASAAADRNVLNTWGPEAFDSKNITRENFAEATGNLESAFRLSDKPNVIDDWVNPASFVGAMAARLGSAPLRAKQTGSNIPYVTALATPLVAGVVGKMVEKFGPSIYKKYIAETPLTGAAAAAEEHAIVAAGRMERRYLASKASNELTHAPFTSGAVGAGALYGLSTLKPDKVDPEMEAAANRIIKSRVGMNENGSTVLMSSSDNKAFPTLFQKEDGSWYQFDDWRDALEEARRLGEVYEFNSDKEADEFAEGAWKNTNAFKKAFK